MPARFCILTAARAAPGQPCPVHHSRDCLVEGWLEYLERPSLLDRVRGWLARRAQGSL